MKIYLDIDGTLIHEELTEKNGQPAAGLTEFIQALKPHQTFWLTTHCRDGNPEKARRLLKAALPTSLHPEIDRIQPTVWDMNKTNGIDWSDDFIWFDDNIGAHELLCFQTAREGQQFIEMNLRDNPNQLLEIIADVLNTD
jgi:hypothetical protein